MSMQLFCEENGILHNFEYDKFQLFCEENGILHNFSTPRTPQQNGVVERKNRSLQEMARTMLNDNSTPKHFWAEAMNTACYLQNKIYIRPILKKTPYELCNGQKPNISYLHPFGCKCFILNTKNNLGKLDSRSDNGTFLSYFETSKAFIVYNSRTLIVEKTIHMRFDENKPDKDLSELDESFVDLRLDDDLIETSSSRKNPKIEESTQQEAQEEVRESIGCIM